MAKEVSPKNYGRWNKTCVKVINKPTIKKDNKSSPKKKNK